MEAMMNTHLPSSRLRQRLESVLSSFLESCHKMMESIFDPYRPELHYMRGPGPKWHAKHQLVPARSAAFVRATLKSAL